MKRTLALLLALAPVTGAAQTCPLIPGRTGAFATASRADGVVSFRSGLAVNADGAPNAYHRVLGPTVGDPGLLHICNGVDVLERNSSGQMVNRYPDFSVSGSSARCKADVFALQEQNFPGCDTESCLRIYGFFAPPRSCGPGRSAQCGVPERALDPAGRPGNFYISTTSLGDPQFPVNDPRRYLDARTIPHFVLPGGDEGPFAMQHGIRLGDIALLMRNGRGVFAVFGDAGPRNKLGEASPAVINRLNGVPDMMHRLPAAIPSGVTTLVLPGSRNQLTSMPPRSAATIFEAGERALAAVGGLDAFAGCAGLGGSVTIARE